MCKTWRWRLRLGLVHLRGEWLLKQAQRCHQLLLQGFDQVVTISNQMRQSLLRGGARSEKVSVIRNWVDLTAINSLAGPNALRRELGLPPNIKIVLYAGSIGVKQALHIVMEVAERLVGNKEFLFVVAGEGPERDRLVRLAGAMSNSIPLQPEDRLRELLALADLHISPTASRGVRSCSALQSLLACWQADGQSSFKPQLELNYRPFWRARGTPCGARRCRRIRKRRHDLHRHCR